MINKPYIKGRVEVVRALAAAKDYEAAHGEEDALHRDVLAAIAEGTGTAAGLAKEALRTTELDFPRPCA